MSIDAEVVKTEYKAGRQLIVELKINGVKYYSSAATQTQLRVSPTTLRKWRMEDSQRQQATPIAYKLNGQYYYSQFFINEHSLDKRLEAVH